MRRTLYWSVERNGGHTHYYLDKEQMLRDWGNAKALIKNIEKFDLVFYSLETEFTDEVLLALLNGKFQHCWLPNYQSAKRIEITKGA